MSALTQREYVIKEVLTTEQDYVADLQLMVDTFLTPLLKKGIISPNESVTLFSNVQTLLNINQDLLNLFEARKEETLAQGKALAEMNIGDILIGFADKLMEYKLYCSNQNLAFAFLDENLKRNLLFADFLENACKLPQCRNLGLQSWLIKPLQRLCKYPLLLRELIKTTPEDWHEECQRLLEADTNISKSVNYVNEESKKYDLKLKGEQELLEELQGSLKDQKHKVVLVKPGRKIIQMFPGAIYDDGKKWKNAMIYLCSDILFVLSGNKPDAPKKLSLHANISCLDVVDVDLLSTPSKSKEKESKKSDNAVKKNLFEVVVQEYEDEKGNIVEAEVRYQCSAVNVDEKRVFLKKIRQLINDFKSQRVKLINLMQSDVTPRGETPEKTPVSAVTEQSKKRAISIGNFSKATSSGGSLQGSKEDLKQQLTSRSLHTLLNDSQLRMRAEKIENRQKSSVAIPDDPLNDPTKSNDLRRSHSNIPSRPTSGSNTSPIVISGSPLARSMSNLPTAFSLSESNGDAKTKQVNAATFINPLLGDLLPKMKQTLVMWLLEAEKNHLARLWVLCEQYVKPIQSAYYERYPDKIELLFANIQQIHAKMAEFHGKKESNIAHFPSCDKFLTYYFAFYIHDVFPLYRPFFHRHLERQEMLNDRYNAIGTLDSALRDLIIGIEFKMKKEAGEFLPFESSLSTLLFDCPMKMMYSYLVFIQEHTRLEDQTRAPLSLTGTNSSSQNLPVTFLSCVSDILGYFNHVQKGSVSHRSKGGDSTSEPVSTSASSSSISLTDYTKHDSVPNSPSKHTLRSSTSASTSLNSNPRDRDGESSDGGVGSLPVRDSVSGASSPLGTSQSNITMKRKPVQRSNTMDHGSVGTPQQRASSGSSAALLMFQDRSKKKLLQPMKDSPSGEIATAASETLSNHSSTETEPGTTKSRPSSATLTPVLIPTADSCPSAATTLSAPTSGTHTPTSTPTTPKAATTSEPQSQSPVSEPSPLVTALSGKKIFQRRESGSRPTGKYNTAPKLMSRLAKLEPAEGEDVTLNMFIAYLEEEDASGKNSVTGEVSPSASHDTIIPANHSGATRFEDLLSPDGGKPRERKVSSTGDNAVSHESAPTPNIRISGVDSGAKPIGPNETEEERRMSRSGELSSNERLRSGPDLSHSGSNSRQQMQPQPQSPTATPPTDELRSSRGYSPISSLFAKLSEDSPRAAGLAEIVGADSQLVSSPVLVVTNDASADAATVDASAATTNPNSLSATPINSAQASPAGKRLSARPNLPRLPSLPRVSPPTTTETTNAGNNTNAPTDGSATTTGANAAETAPPTGASTHTTPSKASSTRHASSNPSTPVATSPRSLKKRAQTDGRPKKNTVQSTATPPSSTTTTSPEREKMRSHTIVGDTTDHVPTFASPREKQRSNTVLSVTEGGERMGRELDLTSPDGKEGKRHRSKGASGKEHVRMSAGNARKKPMEKRATESDAVRADRAERERDREMHGDRLGDALRRRSNPDAGKEPQSNSEQSAPTTPKTPKSQRNSSETRSETRSETKSPRPSRSPSTGRGESRERKSLKGRSKTSDGKSSLRSKEVSPARTESFSLTDHYLRAGLT